MAGQHCPVTGFIVLSVDVHHKTFRVTGTFSGRLFYDIDSTRGFWGALFAQDVLLITEFFFLFRLFS